MRPRYSLRHPVLIGLLGTGAWAILVVLALAARYFMRLP